VQPEHNVNIINPYISYTDQQLCDVIEDIFQSEKDGKRVESFVPYSMKIKENINGSFELITLRESIEIAKKDFYNEVCKRFVDKCKS
jgi:hypothetical protein